MPTITELTARLSAEDYEERRLLETYLELRRRLDKPDEGSLSRDNLTPTSRRDAEAKLKATVLTLGYDPAGVRPPKPRGRPRDASLPKPLPAVGTELQNLFGEKYKVMAYLRRPCTSRDLDVDMIVYADDQGKAAVRSVIHLFCGSLAGVPLVTWPEDPRGLKPGKPIAAHKARTMTQEQFRRQRVEMDADLQQHEQGKHRRY